VADGGKMLLTTSSISGNAGSFLLFAKCDKAMSVIGKCISLLKSADACLIFTTSPSL
jgi:hypothetical protein